MRERRKNRKLGLCADCKSASVKYLCRKCRTKRSAYNKRRRHLLRMKGLCIMCAKPARIRESRCDRCAKIVKAIMQRCRDKKANQRLCDNCHRSRVPGKKLCRIHLNQQTAVIKNRLAENRCVNCGRSKTKRKIHNRLCDRCLAPRRRYKNRIKIEAISRYGGKCACCHISTPEFLTIDHIHGDGSKHRKALKGESIYKWLRRNRYPSGFRVLCFNCNISRGIFGYCPHKRGKRGKHNGLSPL